MKVRFKYKSNKYSKEIKFDHKKNNIRCLAHIINLMVQEILKNIKAGDGQEEVIV